MRSWASSLRSRGWNTNGNVGMPSVVRKGDYIAVVTLRGWVLFNKKVEVGVFTTLNSAVDRADGKTGPGTDKED